MKKYSAFKKILLLIIIILLIIMIFYTSTKKETNYDYIFKGENSDWIVELFINRDTDNQITMVTNFTYKKNLSNLLNKKIILCIKTPYDSTTLTYNYSKLNDIPKKFTSTSISKNSANMLININNSITAHIEINGLLEKFELKPLKK
ncbi:hypothetical protein SH1V18_43590 [Vallitalea longa]|uniref:Uncharacterized protein n=1 Tax=Vallitalea longa TaxID=2936439 RepID=A0A9W6DIG3_9FIRM|nr:hypothetical protein [Vallitalea longa]GKX31879.1 hypothetical protein SH1V18_43590 [Vallitalea longa]